MIAETPRVTRGHGLLESFLAKKRREKAIALIGPQTRLNSLLDIGCGAYPAFLAGVPATDRVGIDQTINDATLRQFVGLGIQLIQQDVTSDPVLRLESERFDAVTMLAVVEHIPLKIATQVISEVYRTLKPGGVFILTTPAAWTDPILRTLACLRLVSAEEIDEHQSLFTQKSLFSLLAKDAFQSNNVRVGTFELGMNLWARAIK